MPRSSLSSCLTPLRATPVAIALVLVLMAASPARSVVAAAPKCKAAQVVVKADQKQICRPATSVFRAPATVDAKLAGLKAALGYEPGRVRGRPVASLRTVLGAKRAATARRKLLRVFTTFRARAHISAIPFRECQDPSFRYSHEQDGAGISISNGRADIVVKVGGDRRVEVSVPSLDCDEFKAPPCPTANGVIDGTDARQQTYRIDVFKGAERLSHQQFTDTGRTSLHGQVAVDAKLDRLDVGDVIVHRVAMVGGSVDGSYVENTTITRTASVDMRTGKYTGDQQATVRSKVTFNGQSDPQQASEQATKAADKTAKDFAAEVQKAIARYRELETEWNGANACAQLDLAPPTNTLKLRAGSTGTVNGTISARAGGAVPDAVTKVTAQSGGTFTPVEARGATPAISYTVTLSRGTLTLTAEATSPAGLARSDWSQPIIAPEPTPTFRIIDFAQSLDMHNERGTRHVDDTFNGIPGTPIVFNCPILQPVCIHQHSLPVQVTTTITNSTVNGPDLECPHAYPSVNLQNSEGVSLDFDPKGTGAATVTGGPPLLAIGDGETNYCHALSTAQAPDHTLVVPRAQILSGTPVALTFSASETVPTESASAASATITYSWTLSVTIVRVNEDGTPYPG